MSTHDSPPTSPAPASAPVARTRSPNIRSLVLVVILLMLLAALWYDYKVARPSVEDAYLRISELNERVNATSGRKYVVSSDVQNELKRQPAETYDMGGYHVEEYHWRAGLPIRKHKYIAVYTSGSPTIFLKHYKFVMEPSELTAVPLIATIPDEDSVKELPGPPVAASSGMGARRKKVNVDAGGSPNESQGKTDSAAEGSAAEKEKEGQEKAPDPSSTPESDDNKPSQPESEKKESSANPTAETTPASEKPEDKKTDEEKSDAKKESSTAN